GLVISEAVASDLDLSAGAVYVLGDHQPSVGSPEDFKHGRLGSRAGAEADAAAAFAQMSGAKLLLVEDELARRTDPDPDPWGTPIFFGDAVVWWVDLSESAVAGPELLRNGSAGYPLNA